MVFIKPAPYSRLKHQRGFVLLSIIFAAILIGIVSLYQARLTQAEVQANQIQLTAERMHQWLQAAMAFYNTHQEWPVSLDFQRYYAGTPVFDNKSNLSNSNVPQAYIDLDLVAQNFMPASIESYYGSTPTKAPIPESPSDTAWALPDLQLENNFLIVADPATTSLACFNYDLGIAPDFDYRATCQIPAADPFRIKAYLPSESVAQQIAAKLPNSWVEAPNAANINRWVVYTSISRSSVQSTSDTIGDGSFVSGFIPLKRPQTGLYSIDTDTDNGAGWNAQDGNNHFGLPYTYGQTPKYVGDNLHARYLYGAGDQYSDHEFGTDSAAFLAFPIFNLRFNTQGDTFDACENPGAQGAAPNLVVSTSGFGAPAVLKYPFVNLGSGTGYHKYINSDVGLDPNLPPSTNPSTFQLLGMGVPCQSNGNNFACTRVLPYSSLYGLILMSFERDENEHHQYTHFLIEAMGMSNQARGATSYVNYDSDDIAAGLNTYADSLQEFDVHGDDRRQPTAGVFPGDGGTEDEADNIDHFWAWSPDQIRDTSVDTVKPWGVYQSGIDGVNFFFYCNKKYKSP